MSAVKILYSALIWGKHCLYCAQMAQPKSAGKRRCSNWDKRRQMSNDTPEKRGAMYSTELDLAHDGSNSGAYSNGHLNGIVTEEQLSA